MALFGCDGIIQELASQDISIYTQKDIINKLNSTDGSTLFKITNNSDQSCIEIKSDKNVVIPGNLYVEGKQVVRSSEEVNIGDQFFTLNADITDESLNAAGGIVVKEVINTAGQLITASAFVNSTNTITTNSAGTLATGNLFYVVGSEYNDGLYKVSTVSATSIVIDTGATEYDVQTSLTDESSASASISEASPKMILHDNGWKMYRYDDNNVSYSLPMLGASGTEAEDFNTNTRPNIGCTGSSTSTSGGYQVGLYDDSYDNIGNPGNVQALATNLDDLFNNADGDFQKSGSTSIANAASAVSVTFSTSFSSALNQVICTIRNTTDGSPLTLAHIVTAKATSGFTVTLSGTTDSANYVLEWFAIGN